MVSNKTIDAKILSRMLMDQRVKCISRSGRRYRNQYDDDDHVGGF